MPNFMDPKFRELNDLNRRAQELLDKSDFPGAHAAFTEVKERARALLLDASWACWGIAICLDAREDFEMAYESMVEALRVDPLNLGKQGSFDAIMHHIRATLANPARAADDASTPRLYLILAQAGEADVSSHLSMARYFAASGDAPGALRILDAVTTLFPGSREAWSQKAAFARVNGDEPLAKRCEAESAGCRAAGQPFGIPSPQLVC